MRGAVEVIELTGNPVEGSGLFSDDNGEEDSSCDSSREDGDIEDTQSEIFEMTGLDNLLRNVLDCTLICGMVYRQWNNTARFFWCFYVGDGVTDVL